ncbi:unnamed protein product, partial [Brassica rapa subsp. trilocularis]
YASPPSRLDRLRRRSPSVPHHRHFLSPELITWRASVETISFLRFINSSESLITLRELLRQGPTSQ